MAENVSSILVADDEEEIRNVLRRILEKERFRVLTAGDGQQAMQEIVTKRPDTVLLDVHMPGQNGMDILKKIKEIDDDLPVVIITAFADIHQAVEAMKDGAYDYLAKPFENSEIVRIARRAMEEGRLKKNLKFINNHRNDNFDLIENMGLSAKITDLAANIHRVAKSDFSVVIVGETGTGKELVAHAIHEDSRRTKGPFVAVDCGAIPENLLESELFGYEKGSFTGADRQKTGKFELAHGGTIFMDEIGNMHAASQTKLLRAIQEREIYRVGGDKPVNVDIRLIAATNHDLPEMVVGGTFSNDLYYRLNEFTIRTPALRERKDDILYLSKRFLNQANVELQKTITNFTDEAVKILMSYNWPGNVRQLRSVIRQATLIATKVITEKDLKLKKNLEPSMTFSPKIQGTPWKNASLREIIHQSVQTVEKEVLTAVLKITGGNKARAARLLHIDYKTMYTKAKKFNIKENGGSNDDKTKVQ